jgi:ParB family chromosome partitioning protein
MPKRRLGKGLEAIIKSTSLLEIEGEKEELIRLPVRAIRPNRFQPRKDFDEESISELADSIREKGIVQPLVVRKAGDGYELVFGERRLRAAKKLALEKVPCVLMDVDDRELLEIALVENLQREDLNPIEEGMAYQALMERFSLSQSDVAAKVGKSRSAVANAVRLLKLPERIRRMILEGKITSGHARALLAVHGESEQCALAEKILKGGLSVRLAEDGARDRGKGRRKARSGTDPRVSALEEAFRDLLGTMVRIRMGRGGMGKVEIHFTSHDDLNRILDILGIEI